MSTSGLLATVDLYTLEKDQLTSQLSDILMDITKVTKISSDLTIEESKKLQAVNDQAKASSSDDSEDSESSSSSSSDNAEYEAQKQDIRDEFELKMASINDWEKQLEMKKANLETQVQAIGSYLESFQTVLKDNIKKDFSYGGK